MGRRAILAQADVSDYPDTFRMAQDVLRELGTWTSWSTAIRN